MAIAPIADAGTQRSSGEGGNMSDKKGGNRVERERESRALGDSISTKHHMEVIAESISTAHHREVLRSSSGTEQGKNSQIVEKEGAVSGPEKIDTSAD